MIRDLVRKSSKQIPSHLNKSPLGEGAFGVCFRFRYFCTVAYAKAPFLQKKLKKYANVMITLFIVTEDTPKRGIVKKTESPVDTLQGEE